MKLIKYLSSILAVVLLSTVFSGCANTNANESSQQIPSSSEEVSQPVESSSSESSKAESSSEAPKVLGTMNIAVMKGPTGMGMLSLMDKNENKETNVEYTFSIEPNANNIVGKLAKGEIDGATVPANLASVLYGKMEGKISVLAINTLGVLDVVESGDDIKSIADLKGKTIYSTGKGTTPEYVLNYILTENNIDPQKDVTIEYKSEASEVAAIMAQDKTAIAVLPQPFVSIAQSKNKDLRSALSLSNEWDKLQTGDKKSSMVTGVLVVRNEFLENNKEVINQFMKDYSDSINFINTAGDDAAKLVGKYEIAPEAIAKNAIPKCNIVYIVNGEMKEKLEGYLEVLFKQNPASIGGKLPDDSFYVQESK